MQQLDELAATPHSSNNNNNIACINETIEKNRNIKTEAKSGILSP